MSPITLWSHVRYNNSVALYVPCQFVRSSRIFFHCLPLPFLLFNFPVIMMFSTFPLLIICNMKVDCLFRNLVSRNLFSFAFSNTSVFVLLAVQGTRNILLRNHISVASKLLVKMFIILWNAVLACIILLLISIIHLPSDVIVVPKNFNLCTWVILFHYF